MSQNFLWTKAAFLEAVAGEAQGVIPEGLGNISIDTRSLKKGDIFFAIKGHRFDGHMFVQKALESGAAVAVVERSQAHQFAADLPLVIVEDVLEALEKLAKAARARSQAKIFAVTGSVGKTTTKEMLRFCLSYFGKTHASPASFNNHWGVPLTLANMPAETEFGIFEIGMNHAGEIATLVPLVRPHIAIITKIAGVHLEYFSSLKAIAQAKAEIFQGLCGDSVAILNLDDEFYAFLCEEAKKCPVKRILSFGKTPSADYALLCASDNKEGLELAIKTPKGQYKVLMGPIGQHNLSNMLAVLGAIEAAGQDGAAALKRLAQFQLPKGRGAQSKLLLDGNKEVTLIDQSYNANPTSMRAALETLGTVKIDPCARRIAVLGDMLELGAASKALHQALLEPIVQNHIDILFLVGSEIKVLKTEVPPEIKVFWAQEVSQILPSVLEVLKNGDVIMVKSSNSIKTAMVVEDLVKHSQANIS